MPLTAKQQNAIRIAPKSDRDRLRALFSAQAARSPNLPLPVGLQPQRTKAQARLPPVPRAATAKPQRVPRPRASLGYVFDGFDHRHLPHDESTAAYATTNFVSTHDFSSSPTVDKIIVIAPRHYNAAEGLYLSNLTDIIAEEFDAGQTHNAIAATAIVRSPLLSTPEYTASVAYTTVRGRVHNMSAEIECLGTSTGLVPPGSVYFGSVPYVEGSSNAGLGTKTLKETWANDSISVGYLKSFSAAGLVQRPVRVHANVAENVTYKMWNDLVVPSTSINLSTLRVCNAMEPIILFVPKAGESTTVVNYRLRIGHQWCSRWPNNPTMRATQVLHQPCSNSLWSEATSFMRNIGSTVASSAAAPIGAAMGRRAVEYGAEAFV